MIRSIDQLDELGQEQVTVAGKRYDGADLPGAERLQGTDGEELDGNLMECRVFKILEGGTHLYDVWSYMVDSGTIFVANTTDVVAEICKFGLECTDAQLAAKLHPTLESKRLVRN